jgi:hypothetical protein
MIIKSAFYILFFLTWHTIAFADFVTAYRECTQKDWKHVQCSFEDERHPQYYEALDAGALRTVYSIIGQLPYITQQLTKLAGEPYWCFLEEVGHTKLDRLLAAMRREREAAGIKNGDCRLACMSACITTYLLNYELCLPTKFGTLATTAAIGKGVCTEYARIGTWLAQELGSNAELTGANHHVFLKVKVGKKTWYLEPQNDSCTFFPED